MTTHLYTLDSGCFFINDDSYLVLSLSWFTLVDYLSANTRQRENNVYKSTSTWDQIAGIHRPEKSLCKLVRVCFSVFQTVICWRQLAAASDTSRQASRSLRPPGACKIAIENVRRSRREEYIEDSRDPCFLELLVVVFLLSLGQVDLKVSQFLLQLQVKCHWWEFFGVNKVKRTWVLCSEVWQLFMTS
jgi:hypothetical protein